MLSSGDQWLCFVQEDGEDGKTEFERALAEVRQNGIPFRVVDGTDLFKHGVGDAVYVLKTFGSTVHTELQQKGCRIVGPMCVLVTLKERSALPESRQRNVFTLAMRGAVVCCTSVGERDGREVLHNLVLLMGGTVQRSLTQSVTHLLAGEVGSAKYNVAHDLKIPTLLPTWIHDAWQLSQSKLLDATQADFVAKHRCPPFKGCSVCVTGIDATVRKDMRRLAEENGAVYAGELNMETTTHLVADKPVGEKYKHARLWGIPCVTQAWFFKSVELRGCENVKKYEVEPGSADPLTMANQQGSGGTGEVGEGSRKRKRPADTQDNLPPMKRVLMPRSSSISVLSTDMPAKYKDLAVQPSSRAYLDGCKILLHGFGGAMLDVLRRIINCGGGTRFNQLNATVSHVILDHPSSEMLGRLQEIQGVKPHVVLSAWLLDSCQADSRLSEETFSCPGMAAEQIEEKMETEQPKPPVHPPKSVSSMPAPSEPLQPWPAQKPSDSGSILAQYASAAISSSSTPEGRSSVGVVTDSSVGVVTDSSVGNQPSAAPSRQAKGLLSSLRFSLSTGDAVCNALASKLVQKAGGKVVDTASTGDYTVACLSTGQEEGKQQVTLFWLEKCITSATLLPLDSDPLFQPCAATPSAGVLRDVVLSLSQYEGQLRSQLSKLAVAMGATVQDHFVRKASKGLKASTHLLCQSASGSKYAAAQRWFLPAVGHQWLIACSQQHKVASGEGFLVTLSAGSTVQSASSTPAGLVHPGRVSAASGTGLTPRFLQTSAAASPCLSTAVPVSSGTARSFLPAFDTADAEAALQSPAVVAAKRRNRSSGIALEEMFQNNLASAVGVCTAAAATENEHTALEKAAGDEAALRVADKTPVAAGPAAAGRRSVRRGKRHVKMSLEGVSVQPASASASAASGHLPATSKGTSPMKRSASQARGGLVSPEASAAAVSPAKGADESGSLDKKTAASVPEVPTAGTLEVREAFEREMEELMALTSNSRNSNGRTSARRSSRLSRNALRGSPSKDRSDGCIATGSPSTGTGGSGVGNLAASYTKLSSSSSAVAATDLDQANSDPLNGVELSQTEMITYDDPNGRLARERIIAELMEAPDVGNDFPPPAEAAADKASSVMSPKAAVDDEAGPLVRRNSVTVATPTPPVPVPMIAALRPAAKVRPPLATEDLTVSQTQSRAAQLKFHLTALSQAEKADYIVLIEKLGGKVYDTMFFSTSSTHLIVGKPSRSEKYLGALASGKWLLRKSFLEASRQAGRFVEENPHEWGAQLHNQGKPEAIELAAQRWRLLLQDERIAQQLEGAPSRFAVGAFTNWRVLLSVSREKQAGLRRLLEAGGAKIVKSTPPFNNLKGVSHAFIEVAKAPVGSIDFSKLKEASVHCCRPEYIAEYLIQDPRPDVKKYYLSDVYTKRRGSS